MSIIFLNGKVLMHSANVESTKVVLINKGAFKYQWTFQSVNVHEKIKRNLLNLSFMNF